MIRRVLSGLADVEASAVVAVVRAVRGTAAWFEALTGWRRFLADVVFLIVLAYAAMGLYVALWYLHH